MKCDEFHQVGLPWNNHFFGDGRGYPGAWTLKAPRLGGSVSKQASLSTREKPFTHVAQLSDFTTKAGVDEAAWCALSCLHIPQISQEPQRAENRKESAKSAQHSLLSHAPDLLGKFQQPHNQMWVNQMGHFRPYGKKVVPPPSINLEQVNSRPSPSCQDDSGRCQRRPVAPVSPEVCPEAVGQVRAPKHTRLPSLKQTQPGRVH